MEFVSCFNYTACVVHDYEMLPSILVGATLVVSGDGRYFSKEAIQVHFHRTTFFFFWG